jgi:hypothetical protein
LRSRKKRIIQEKIQAQKKETEHKLHLIIFFIVVVCSINNPLSISNFFRKTQPKEHQKEKIKYKINLILEKSADSLFIQTTQKRERDGIRIFLKNLFYSNKRSSDQVV